MNDPLDLRDAFRGALLGLAAGDALGTTLEFKRPGSFEPIHEIVGGGPFDLEAGQWTDDTSMTLCLAASLAECGGFDACDQMKRYVRWWRDGYMGSRPGAAFDIGVTVSDALRRFEQTGDPFAGSDDPYSAGNGSLMRLAPVVLRYVADADEAVLRAAESSRTTHAAATAVDACRYFAGLLVGALGRVDKEELLSPRWSPIPSLWEAERLTPEIDEVACGSFKRRDPPEIKGTGYVVRCLEAALWAFDRSDDFRARALLAVNLGDDADTTGAVYGQLAGAFYGEVGIPAEWRERLALRDVIESAADRLHAQARAQR